jgi:Amt family ammonium transporter
VILKVIALVAPLRRTGRDEGVGLDVVQHGEEAYARGEGALLVPFDTAAPARLRAASLDLLSLPEVA